MSSYRGYSNHATKVKYIIVFWLHSLEAFRNPACLNPLHSFFCDSKALFLHEKSLDQSEEATLVALC